MRVQYITFDNFWLICVILISMEKRRIERILKKCFEPKSLKVIDDSNLHATHLEARKGGGHYRVEIVADAFRDKTALERHRMVYDALSAQWKGLIHAMSIKAEAPASKK